MTRLHDHSYTLRLQDFSDRECHLLRQPLLDLKSTGKHLCKACQFGETQYSSYNPSALPNIMISWQHTIWNVAYVHLNKVNIKISKHIRSLKEKTRESTFPVKGTI